MREWLESMVAGLKLAHADRSLFYRLLAEQLSAGVPLGQALRSIAGAALPSPLTNLAQTCADAVEEGRTLAAGMADAGSIPRADRAFVDAAQRHEALPDVLAQMVERDAAEESLAAIFTSNAYWLVIFVLLLTVLYNGDVVIGPFAEINPAAADTLLARTVGAVQRWGVIVAIAVAVLMLTITWGRWAWYGPSRRVLGGLATEYERRIAIRICDVASLLLPTGVEHGELLRVAQETAHSGYAREGGDEAAGKLAQGLSLPAALKDTLFDDTALAVLDQLAPAGRPDRFGPAFGAVGRLLSALQENFYRRGKRAVFLAVLLADAGGVLIVLTGVIQFVSIAQSTILQ